MRGQDRFEDLVDKLLVVGAAEGCGTVFGTTTGVYDKGVIVGKGVGVELGEPELSDAFDEWVALRAQPGRVAGVVPVVEDV